MAQQGKATKFLDISVLLFWHGTLKAPRSCKTVDTVEHIPNFEVNLEMYREIEEVYPINLNSE